MHARCTGPLSLADEGRIVSEIAGMLYLPLEVQLKEFLSQLKSKQGPPEIRYNEETASGFYFASDGSQVACYGVIDITQADWKKVGLAWYTKVKWLNQMPTEEEFRALVSTTLGRPCE